MVIGSQACGRKRRGDGLVRGILAVVSDDAAIDDEVARVVDLRRTYDGEKTHEPGNFWLRNTSQSSISAHVTFVGDGISVKLTGWNSPADKGVYKTGWPDGQMTLRHGEAVRLRNLLSQWLSMSDTDPGEYLVIRLDEATELGDDTDRGKRRFSE
jgi:hypothetical protein